MEDLQLKQLSCMLITRLNSLTKLLRRSSLSKLEFDHLQIEETDKLLSEYYTLYNKINK